MEDCLNNFFKWKKTSIIFWKMEDDLIFYKSKKNYFFLSNGKILNNLVNVRWPKRNKNKWILCSFKEQHHYFRQPDQHNNPKNIGTTEEEKNPIAPMGWGSSLPGLHTQTAWRGHPCLSGHPQTSWATPHHALQLSSSSHVAILYRTCML